jgi:hypothetical protein
MTFILTQPVSTSSSSSNDGLTRVNNIPIAAGATVTVDSLSLVDLKMAKWSIVIENLTTTERRSFELQALNKFSIDSDHTIYARMGDKIDTDININITTQFNLDITNNESDTLYVSFIRDRIS